MNNFQNWHDAGGKIAVASPAKNRPGAFHHGAEMRPPSRQKHNNPQVSGRWSVEIRTILIYSPAIKNTLQTTENKQQSPFLICSVFAKYGASRNSDQLVALRGNVETRSSVLLSAHS